MMIAIVKNYMKCTKKKARINKMKIKLLVILLVVFFIVGCGAKNDTTSAEKNKKQVYVFIRDRGDLSYWDSMASGSDKAAKDFKDKADIYVVETTSDLQANLQAMHEAIDKNANLIITAGDFKDNLVEVANENPEVGFVIINEDVLKNANNKNVYGIDFATSEAAFLGGIVAADIASNGKNNLKPSNVIGFIGGMDETLVIQEFLYGYLQGANYFKKDIKVVSNYVGAWNDPDTAKTQAKVQFNDAKANVIFACAGGSGNGVHHSASENGKYVIGVDSDQSLMYKKDENIQKRFATSVIKDAGQAIYNAIEQYIKDDKLPYNEYRILGLKDGAVGIVENQNLDILLSDHGKAILKEAKQGIIEGKIKIDSAIGKSQEEIKKLLSKYFK